MHIDSQGLYTTGIYCDNIVTKQITKIDDSGNVAATYPGRDGGFLYKDPATGMHMPIQICILRNLLAVLAYLFLAIH
jgi:hypothetical protein